MAYDPVLGPQIARVSHKHDAIILWLLTYPDRKLSDCAEYFGYTQAWLSTIIHSDMFQMAYREKANELGTATVHTLRDKLTNLAVLTVDKITERVEAGIASERLLGETMRNTLSSLGYGSSAPTVDARSQQVHFHLDAEKIIEARERAATARAGTTPSKIEEPAAPSFLDTPTPKGSVQ